MRDGGGRRAEAAVALEQRVRDVEPAEGDKGQWVPLAEAELLDSHVKDFPALLVRKVRAKEPPSPPALDLAPPPQRT